MSSSNDGKIWTLAELQAMQSKKDVNSNQAIGKKRSRRHRMLLRSAVRNVARKSQQVDDDDSDDDQDEDEDEESESEFETKTNKRGTPWSNQDCNILIKLDRQQKSKEYIAKKLGRTPSAITSKLWGLKRAGKLRVNRNRNNSNKNRQRIQDDDDRDESEEKQAESEQHEIEEKAKVKRKPARKRKRKRDIFDGFHSDDFYSETDDDEKDLDVYQTPKRPPPRRKVKKTSRVYEWSVNDILAFFIQIGMEHHVETVKRPFEEQEVDGYGLKRMNVKHLLDFGIMNFQDRLYIIDKIKTL